MPPIFDSIKKGTEIIRASVREQYTTAFERSHDELVRLQGTLIVGTLYLVEKMSLLMDRSLELIDSQMEESRLQKDVLRLKKKILERKLKDDSGE